MVDIDWLAGRCRCGFGNLRIVAAIVVRTPAFNGIAVGATLSWDYPFCHFVCSLAPC